MNEPPDPIPNEPVLNVLAERYASQAIRDIWSHFGINQKFSLILAVAAVAGIMGGILYWSGRPSFALLYSGMTLEDAAACREKLADQRDVHQPDPGAGRARDCDRADVDKLIDIGVTNGVHVVCEGR